MYNNPNLHHNVLHDPHRIYHEYHRTRQQDKLPRTHPPSHVTKHNIDHHPLLRNFRKYYEYFCGNYEIGLSGILLRLVEFDHI